MNLIEIKTEEKPAHWPFPSAQGKVVYDRTYSRTFPDGAREVWFDTVNRVAKGNLAFAYGSDMSLWASSTSDEYHRLTELMGEFKIIPGGRHLWSTGVPGREHCANCFYAHWTPRLSEHFTFKLLRLAEGGGVGSNYSNRYIYQYPTVKRALKVHIVCDPEHPDYLEMLEAGIISTEFSHEWTGAFVIEDTREGWAAGKADLIDTFVKDAPVKHQDRVYDVSRLRRKGAALRSSGGTASGPAPYGQMMIAIGEIMSARFEKNLRSLDLMEIDHEIGSCIIAGGSRRSARMSLKSWRDADIFDFISCKRNSGKHWTTNISVEIDNEFIALLQGAPENELGQHAHAVYLAVITGMLTNGEPGFWNYDLHNQDEPNEVHGCNPCGEISLLGWESCLIGHVNLDAYVNDFEGMKEAHRLMTRFLIRSTFSTMNDEKQAEVVAKNRRIGVGHFGVQAYIAKNYGMRISDLEMGDDFSDRLDQLYQEVRDEARAYAFQLRIPEPIKVTTVAPTGSIAKLPGVTEGIHPIYATHFERRIRFSTINPREIEQFEALALQGYAVEDAVNEKDTAIVVIPTKDKLVEEVEALGYTSDLVESCDKISLTNMMKFQAIYQTHYVDNAISFTANVPATPEQNEYFLENPWGTEPPEPPRERIDEVAETLLRWLPYLKGTTMMPDGTRPQAPYTRISEAQYEQALMKVVEDGTNDECRTGCPVR